MEALSQSDGGGMTDNLSMHGAQVKVVGERVEPQISLKKYLKYSVLAATYLGLFFGPLFCLSLYMHF